MYLKIHPTPKGEVVALCDASMLGKVFSDGKRRLDLSAHADFYSGRKVTRPEAIAALRGAQNINVVGKKSISAAKGAGFDVSKRICIGEAEHLQAYRL